MEESYAQQAENEMWDAIASQEPPKRFAVAHTRTRREAEAYLPDNYEVITDHDADPYGRYKNCVIQGVDRAGWTLEYVIARYASGMIPCREHRTRHDAEDAACAAMN